MRISVRSFVVFFLSSILYLLSSVPIFAQQINSSVIPAQAGIQNRTWIPDRVGNDKLKVQDDKIYNPYAIPNTNPDVPKNTHTLTQTIMIDVMGAVVCQLAGIDLVNKNQKCLGIDSNTGKIGFVENGGGLIGLTTNGIAMLYTPPIHGTDYFNYLASNFGISKPAYAQQGYGFGGISPLQKIWLGFTKIVYLIFIVVFIVIGLAIMLRVKIDPRTVMSIENQIPKIIVGLILVTFSFAIAGFLIDIMWVSMYLVLNVLGGFDPSVAANATRDLHSSPLGFVNETFKQPLVADKDPGGFLSIALKTSGDLGVIFRNLFTPKEFWELFPGPADCKGDIGCWFGKGISLLNPLELLKTFIPQLMGYLASFIVSIVAFVIIAIALLSALIRLWFRLIFAYIVLLLDVIMGPFFIISGVIPGGPGVGAWLRDIIGNLATFPTVLVMFLFGKILMDAFAKSPDRLFVPPFIGDPNGEALGSLIGLGFVLMTPSMMDKVKNAIKAPKIDLSPIGQSIGTGAGAVNAPKHMTTIGQYGYYKQHYYSKIPGLNKIPFFKPKPGE